MSLFVSVAGLQAPALVLTDTHGYPLNPNVD
jgi:hypothetical protein